MSAAQVWLWAGWALGGVGVVVLAWALFWDRAKGRKRCPKCWYSMEGVVQSGKAASGQSGESEGLEEREAVYRCPECGHGVVGERGLLRTRRRWGFAAAGPLLVIVGVGSEVGLWARMPAMAPSLVLAACADMHKIGPSVLNAGPMEVELQKRIDARGLDRWSWRLLHRRYFADRPEEGLTVQSRSSWPKGIPIVVSFRLPELTSSGTSTEVVEYGIEARLCRSAAGGPGAWERALDSYLVRDLELGIPANGLVEVDVHLTLDGKLVWSGRQSTAMMVLDHGAELHAIDSPDLTNQIQDWMHPRLAHDQASGRTFLCVEERGVGRTVPSGCALGIRFLLMKNDEIAGTAAFGWGPELGPWFCGNAPTWEVVQIKWRTCPPSFPCLQEPGWQVLAIGDHDVALRCYDHWGWTGDSWSGEPWREPDVYWAGQFRANLEITTRF